MAHAGHLKSLNARFRAGGIPAERRIAGQGAVFLCAVLWSTSGLCIKLVDWHPAQIAGGRSFLAVLVLLLLRLVSRGRTAAPAKILLSAVSGLCYALTMFLFVFANKLTAPANAIVLQYTAPIWTCLLAWFFLGERPRRAHWAALAMVGGGMFLVFRSGLAGGSLPGDCLALVSGLCFGANTVIMRAQKDGNPADIMIAAHVITAACSIPFFVLYPPALKAGAAAGILFMGIFQIGAASALFAYGIRRTSAVQAMLTAAVEPVLNPVWVLLVTGERPALPVIAGGSVIIAAAVFSAVMGRER